MTRIKIMGLSLVAAFAIAAVFAGGAFSAATPVNLKTAKGALAPGAPLKAESTDLVFTTEAGNLECTSNILEGTLTNNGASKDKGSLTSESSTGGEAGGLCKTTTPFGPAQIVTTGLPFPTEFSSKSGGLVTIKGSKKVTFTSTFPAAGGAKCTFEASKVISTFKNGGGPVVITTNKQLFKKNKKTSNEACPATGTLSGTFTVTSAGETVES